MIRSKDEAKGNGVEGNEELMSKIKKLWRGNMVEKSMQKMYKGLIGGLSADDVRKFLKKEVLMFQGNTAPVQIVMKAIKSREESISTLKAMNQLLGKTKDWVRNSRTLIESAEILHAHRMITLSVVESLENWSKSLMKSFNACYIPFLYQDSEYLLQMQSDCAFLAQSELSKVFKFSPDQDIFLLATADPLENISIKSHDGYFVRNGRISVPIPNGMNKRFSNLQDFISNGRLKTRETQMSSGLQSQRREKSYCDVGIRQKASLVEVKTDVRLKRDKEKEDWGENKGNISAKIRKTRQRSGEIRGKEVRGRAQAMSVKGVESEACRFDNFHQSRLVQDEKKIKRLSSGQFRSKRNNPKLEQEIHFVEEIKRRQQSVQITRNNARLVSQENLSSQLKPFKSKEPIKFRADKQEAKLLNTAQDSDKPSLELSLKRKIIEKSTRSHSFHNPSQLSLERSSHNSRTLHLTLLMNSIIRNYIEEIIDFFNLPTLIELCLSELLPSHPRYSLSSLFTSIDERKLQDHFYNLILTEFLTQPWLISLASTLIAHTLLVPNIEDYVLEVFTPGIHSPNVISDHNTINESLHSASMSTEINFSHLLSLQNEQGTFVPIGCNRKSIKKALKIYYQKLPKVMLEALEDVEEVIRAAECGEAVEWYWYVVIGEIEGCLVYSGSCFEEGTADIYHVSALKLELFEEVLQAGINKVKDFEYTAANVRIKLNSALSIHSVLLKSSCKECNGYYKWGNSQPKASGRISIYSNICSELVKQHLNFPYSTCEEMLEFGTRYLELAHISQLVLESSSEIPAAFTRLQQDLFELLSISSSLSYHSLPYITNLPSSSSSENSSLTISFSLLSSSYFSNASFTFIRLTQIFMNSTGAYSIYHILTSDPNITVSIIEFPNITKELKIDLKISQTDLFHKVEGLIVKEELEELGELWLPVFEKKKKKWEAGWMSEIKINDEERRWTEIVEVNYRMPNRINSQIPLEKAKVIEGEFIFVVRCKEVEEMLDIPVFVCLVTKSDWKPV